MSLFSLLDGMEDDPFFGSHMRTMRQVNSMMTSFFPDSMFMVPPAIGFGGRTAAPMAPFGGFPAISNINRLLSGSLDSLNSSHSYSSSTVVSMMPGPDGRPQVYKATSSTRSAPGGVRETQNTVCDSRTGTKKMSIGHHIGDRAHIIEREQNVRSGDQEERQDFINLDEDEAGDFNREWETRTKIRGDQPRLDAIRSTHRFPSYAERHGHGHAPHGNGLLAITAGPSSQGSSEKVTPTISSRRGIRSSKPSSSRHPYNPPTQVHSRKNKNMKSVSGSNPTPDM